MVTTIGLSLARQKLANDKLMLRLGGAVIEACRFAPIGHPSTAGSVPALLRRSSLRRSGLWITPIAPITSHDAQPPYAVDRDAGDARNGDPRRGHARTHAGGV
jgi:hypothetical protein